MIILIASQEHGMLIHDDGITEADLLYPRWLIPARDYRKPGDEYAAHINYKRHAIGCELNPEYIELAHQRIAQTQPMLFAEAQP